MADYTNWLKRCAYRSADITEPTLYQGLGPANTALIFYGAPGLDTAFWMIVLPAWRKVWASGALAVSAERADFDQQMAERCGRKHTGAGRIGRRGRRCPL